MPGRLLRMSRNNDAPSLAELPLHGSGRVLRVNGSGPFAERLAELGFVPGTQVELLRRAPLGDPLLFRLRGTEIALRRREARCIEIAPEAA